MLECQSLLELERRTTRADTPAAEFEDVSSGFLGRSQETSLSTLLTDTSLSSIGGLGYSISSSSSSLPQTPTDSSSPRTMMASSTMPPLLPTDMSTSTKMPPKDMSTTSSTKMIPPAPSFPPPPVPSKPQI